MCVMLHPCTSLNVTLDFKRHFQSFLFSPFNAQLLIPMFSPISNRKIVIKPKLIFYWLYNGPHFLPTLKPMDFRNFSWQQCLPFLVQAFLGMGG